VGELHVLDKLNKWINIVVVGIIGIIIFLLTKVENVVKVKRSGKSNSFLRHLIDLDFLKDKG
ncbi:hypothetical protein KKB11_02745, partial [Candidatus Micrarchaeota archaeon]|nr:hypothetical protein [Candidatus Micrarchaeota archaeon]